MKNVLNMVVVCTLVCAAAVVFGPAAFADPPVVPAVPTDAFPTMTLADYLKPLTAMFPTMVGALMAVLVGAGIIWIVDFTWRRSRKHNK